MSMSIMHHLTCYINSDLLLSFTRIYILQTAGNTLALLFICVLYTFFVVS